MYFLSRALRPVMVILPALMTLTSPWATTFLAKSAACLPSSALAAALATRPTVLPCASIVVIKVLDEFNKGHLCSVAFARAGLYDAQVSAGALFVITGHFDEACGIALAAQLRDDHAAVGERRIFTLRYQFLHHRADLLGACHGSHHFAAQEQI